jgi:glycosyltransferase involved in cell wall biosynthesis
MGDVVPARDAGLVGRLLILDPGLITVLGHNYSEANALLREARDLRLSARIVAHRKAHAAVVDIPAEPFFRQDSYGHMADARPATDFMAISFSNRAILEDLRSLTAAATPRDFIFFPTVTCNIVLAICQWLAGFPPAASPRFGLCLMFAPDRNAVARPSAVALETYRQAFALIPPTMMNRIVFTCETEALSQVYERLLGVPPVTLPVPTWANLPVQRVEREGTQISFLGGARAEKGFHLLPDIVASVREGHPHVRFTIQAFGFDADYVRPIIRRLAEQGDVVTLIEKPVSDEELRLAMTRSDLLLLPYDRERYGDRGSSLFTEAKRTATPMVLPEGTEIGREGRDKGIATTFAEFTAGSVAEAAIRAVRQLDRLRLAAVAEARVQRPSGSAYLSTLLARVAPAS